MSEAELLSGTRPKRPNAEVDAIVGAIAAALTRADAKIARLLQAPRVPKASKASKAGRGAKAPKARSGVINPVCAHCARRIAAVLRDELMGTALAESIRKRTEAAEEA